MEHFRCNMDARDWQLYSASMDCSGVADILNKSFDIMARDIYGGLLPSKLMGKEPDAEIAIHCAKKLQEQMRTAMSVWSRYGAYDSEPDGMLAYQVGKCHEHYLGSIELEVGRWGIREVGSDVWI